MRRNLMRMLAGLCLVSANAYADIFDDLLDYAKKQTGLQEDIRTYTQKLTVSPRGAMRLKRVHRF